jgi:proteasome assembly chaperone (PAC2) family protein
VRYDQGIVKELDLPQNLFHHDESEKLIFFLGREPNLRWQEFADCIFAFARQAGIERIYFMGSFGGAVPHTRQPRMFASVSHAGLRPLMRKHGFDFTDYHGPSSFATTLLSQCPEHDIEMMNLVCEIPGYLQGANPPSIEAVTRKLAHLLNLQVDLDALRRASDEWEIQVTQAVEKDTELAETVRKLEEQYDNELIGKGEE